MMETGMREITCDEKSLISGIVGETNNKNVNPNYLARDIQYDVHLPPTVLTTPHPTAQTKDHTINFMVGR